MEFLFLILIQKKKKNHNVTAYFLRKLDYFSLKVDSQFKNISFVWHSDAGNGVDLANHSQLFVLNLKEQGLQMHNIHKRYT